MCGLWSASPALQGTSFCVQCEVCHEGTSSSARNGTVGLASCLRFPKRDSSDITLPRTYAKKIGDGQPRVLTGMALRGGYTGMLSPAGISFLDTARHRRNHKVQIANVID
jgi:hypothetical protein